MNGVEQMASSSTHALLNPLPWETRNLGVPSFGLDQALVAALDPAEFADYMNAFIQKHPRMFAHARIEQFDNALIARLGRLGFYYVENTVDPFSYLKKNAVFLRFLEDPGAALPHKFTCRDLALTALDRTSPSAVKAVREIARESFVADRFHIDWQCSEDIANQRFVYWVDDLFTDAAVDFSLLLHQTAVIGFFAHRADNLVLAGFTRIYANMGLGDFFWLSVLERLYRSGIHSVHTRMSTNNLSVLNLYARLGFKFRNNAVLLHYWKK